MRLLAHSAQGDIAAQPYLDHVLAVYRGAKENIETALNFFSGSSGKRHVFHKAVSEGSLFHDLGKLDTENQAVLSRPDSREKLPLNHCDAGTAWLLRNGALNGALLVYCHHAGLFTLSEERIKNDGNKAFRDLDVAEVVDKNLNTYLEGHGTETNPYEPSKDSLPLKGLSLRIALSCLVDADHHDTAFNYGNEVGKKNCPTRWSERQEALQCYVEGLQKVGKKDSRNQLRGEIFDACAKAPVEPPLKCCDAPVGSGKTTAIMAHLLKVASEKQLRHVFVVLPYTNIIRQSVDVYRKALVLPEENPEEVVGAHYHQADFADLNSRHLATLWRAPIIVTSSVQFFETLSMSNTSRLRKLHELPGAAVFVDESHAAMPLHVWPQQWSWMRELADEWGVNFVLASGSLVKFWEFPDFSERAGDVPNLLPESLQSKARKFESKRVVYPDRNMPMNRQELISYVLSKPGPRLVILNTVQSAAVIAHEMRKAGHQVIHLSTSLAPIDRNAIIEKVHKKLKESTYSDWTLVATSCVEAGVDFSFKTAFRESCSVTSLIQTGGGANRQGSDIECEVIDFRVRDPLLNKHPAFETSRTVLDQMFDAGLMNMLSPMELATESFKRELGKNDVKSKAELIKKMELRQDYRDVAKLARIIDADTRTVVVKKSIIERLNKKEKVLSTELLQHSVQLWSDKISKLGLLPFEHYKDIYSLGGYSYDAEFLGYMDGLLPLVYQYEEGLII